MKTLQSITIISSVLIAVILVLVTPTISAQPGRVFFGSQQPQFSVTDNKLDVIWDYYNPDDSMYLVTSSDGGSSFSEKIHLNKNSTWDMGIGNTVINDNNVYHVWTQLSEGTQIFFVKSHDYGLTFTEPMIITGNQNTLQHAEIDKFFASGNNIYVVWSINRFLSNQPVGTLFLSKSTDGGISFAEPIVLSEKDIAWSDLQTATTGNKTYFMWQSPVSQECVQDNCNAQVHIRSMENNSLGKIYYPIIVHNTGPLKISASGDNVYLTGVTYMTDSLSHVVNGVRVNYVNVTAPQWISFTKSVDGGITFDKIVNLSGTRHHCTLGSSGGVCEIAGVYSYTVGKNIYTIWSASNYTSNASNAFFISSTDNGDTFGNVIQLNPHGLDNVICTFSDPCVNIQASLTSPDTVFLVWNAGKANMNGDHVIFAKSTDAGKSFDYNDISNVTKITSQPVLSLGSGVIYIAGTRPGFPEGNHEFFTRSIDSGNTFSDGIDLDMKNEVSVPEFPFTIPVLFVSMISLVVFYRIKFRN